MALVKASYLDGVTTVAVDLVDTLVEYGSELYITRASEYLNQLGCDIEPGAYRKLFRERFLEYTMGNYEDDREFLGVLAADLPGAVTVDSLGLLIDLRLEASPALQNATSVLAALNASYRVLLATNYVGDWARRILARDGWLPYFDATVISGDIRSRKPARRFFQTVWEVSRAVDPSEVLMVGDSYVNDVVGASSYGFRTVLVDRGGGVEAADRGTSPPPPRRVASAVVGSLAEFRLELETRSGGD